jgi:hypothetical protein
LDKYPKYANFFKRAVLNNREVLLDNSIFELGVSFDPKEYAKKIEWLRPTYYIVPDVLEDSKATINSWGAFNAAYYSLPGLKIGVVQGKTLNDIVECYKFMSANADYIAISFDFSYYQTTGLGNTKFERYADGRQQFINNLIDRGIWNWNKPHHLLGVSLPQELKYYIQNDIYNIRSVDTSNPVMAGITGMKYAGDLGLKEKPKGLLADNLNITLTPDQSDLIYYNITALKRIIGKDYSLYDN